MQRHAVLDATRLAANALDQARAALVNAATRAEAEASAVAAQAREKDAVQAWLRSNRPDLLDRSGGGGGGGGDGGTSV